MGAPFYQKDAGSYWLVPTIVKQQSRSAERVKLSQSRLDYRSWRPEVQSAVNQDFDTVHFEVLDSTVDMSEDTLQ